MVYDSGCRADIRRYMEALITSEPFGARMWGWRLEEVVGVENGSIYHAWRGQSFPGRTSGSQVKRCAGKLANTKYKLGNSRRLWSCLTRSLRSEVGNTK